MNRTVLAWVIVVLAVIAGGYFVTTLVVGNKQPVESQAAATSSTVLLEQATTTLKVLNIPATTNTSTRVRTISVAGNEVWVTVADTPATRARGLGGRSGLSPNEGMLFVFPKDGIFSFWMKDMLFSIDMIWISADGHIVYMAQNISPDTYPKPFVPTSTARYVLEVSAGYAAAHHLAVGDMVQL